ACSPRAWISHCRCDVGPFLSLTSRGPGKRPKVETVMLRRKRIRPFALAAALALLSLPGVTRAQCLITGDSSLCNGPVQLCGPDGLYEYLWIDPAGQFSFDRCLMATQAGTYMLRITDQFGQSFGPCSKAVEASNPPPCVITGPDSPDRKSV